jgi:hypothetical protein
VFNFIDMRMPLRYILIQFLLVFALQIGASASNIVVVPENSISIYPNPIVYEANITLDKSIVLSGNEVSIYFFNIVGEEVHQIENIQNHKLILSKEYFKKSGIYLYQLKVNGQVLKTGKINVQ